MSAQLAIAQPRRIKATHRRRRKVTAGHFVQRYYDPQIGRFLSVDPVASDTTIGWNFNRYNYAANNPLRYYDPDGRVVRAVDSDEQQRLVDYINERTSVKYEFDDNGELVRTDSETGSEHTSSSYESSIDALISSNKLTALDIGNRVMDVRDMGGGITLEMDTAVDGSVGQGFTGHRGDGGVNVTISGLSEPRIRGVLGQSIGATPADIMMHEIVAHASPIIQNLPRENAVRLENKARHEAGLPLRAPESTRQHPSNPNGN